MLSDNKIVVLFSGGQDSTTCLMWALANYKKENILPISFYYGQRHSVELEYAKEVLTFFGLDGFTANLNHLLSGSSLVDHGQNVNEAHSKDENLPSTFTAGRNALFLTVAAAYGYDKDALEIVTGVCETDYSGYPDCRQDFVTSQEQTLSLALGKKVKIHTPLMQITKAETWKLAKELGQHLSVDGVDLIRTMTLTDYKGNTTMNDWGRGAEDNPASILRAKGYREAKEKGWI